jgi:hypothetical protein
MTSRPATADQDLASFKFPARLSTSTTDSDSGASFRSTTAIPPSASADARPKRPGLKSRNSESSSTRTIRPRHVSQKSSSAIPTLSNLNVRNSTLPTYWTAHKMNPSTGGSSGAADLLRQAMMQR